MKRISHILLAAFLAAGLIGAPATAANNFDVKDAAAATKTKCAKDVGSGVLADCNILTDAAGAALIGQKTAAGSLPVALPSDQTVPVSFSRAVAGGNFTRPANTTAYAFGQLVANSTTAASVAPISASVARSNGGTGTIYNLRLSKTGTSLTNASFRVHLYKGLATADGNGHFVTSTVGDGGTFAGAINAVAAIEIGYIDITMDVAGSDGAKGFGTVPPTRNPIIFDADASRQTIFALVEARAAYTPISGEMFTAALEVDRDQ